MRFVDPHIEQDREWLRTLKRQVMESSFDQTPSTLSYCLESLCSLSPASDRLERLRHLGTTDPTVVAYLNPDGRSLPLLPVAPELHSACLLGVCDRITRAVQVGRGGSVAVSTIIPFLGIGENLKERLATFKSDFFSPLMDELDRCLVKGDWLLGLLWRYKREVEWFEQDELLAKFGPARGEGQDWLEDDLERHLQRFLHRSGVAFPFSQPRIPEARPDIVLPSEKTPLPIELKVHDGAKRGVRHVLGGVAQALDYAQKYQSPFGYLVVFNVANAWLQIGADPKPGVPRVDKQNKAIFIVPIQVTRMGAPSKRNTYPTTVITEEQLQ